MTKIIKKALIGVATTAALGLGIAGVTASGPASAAISHPCSAVTTYGGWGPGGALRYQAFDRYCDGNYNAGGTWKGPLRVKRSTADHDRDVRNAGRY